MTNKNYIQTIKNLKDEILKSRYTIAKVANRELLFLYYKVGKIISEKVDTEKWGNKTIQKLSNDLQNELKGLRGFSYSNLRKMKLFYGEWKVYLNADYFKNSISQTLTGQLGKINLTDTVGQIRQTLSSKLYTTDNQSNEIEKINGLN